VLRRNPTTRWVAALPVVFAVVLGTFAVGGERDAPLDDTPSMHVAGQLAQTFRAPILPAPDEIPDSAEHALNSSEPTIALRCCSIQRPLAIPDMPPPVEDIPPTAPIHTIETRPG
jgi:hypothetical protein